MVVLAVAISTKSGKTLVSRQFVEMTRIRIEGLLAAFPKLLGSNDKQHTFVETEAVRYVYQPLENLYLLAITNRASNIIEDLETLQLLSKVVPDVAGNMNSISEETVVDNAFELIFAFDEVITSGGYREPINLQQIKVNMEMESHEETLHNMIKISKMETARDKARDAERSIRERRAELPVGGMGGGGGRMEGFGSGGGGGSMGGRSSMDSSIPGMNSSASAPAPAQPSYASSKPSRAPVKGMSLFATGGKNKSLEDAMAKEDKLAPVRASASLPEAAASAAASVPQQIQHPVMLAVVEKVNASITRDGTVNAFDVKGNLTLTAADEDAAKCAVQIKPMTARDFTFNCNPKVNKAAFDQAQVIQLKDPSKGFPVQRGVGVLKWTYTGDPEALLPLKINCWPEEESRGRMNVCIDYEMNVSVDAAPNLEMHNVQIHVPLGTADSPDVVAVDGSFGHNPNTGELIWQVPLIDRSNATGSLEFNISQKDADAFFPINVTFSSQTLFCPVEADSVKSAESGLPIMFGASKVMMTDEYVIE